MNEDRPEKKRRVVFRELREWVIALGIGLLLALFITQVLIVNAEVPTGSMQPTILAGDRIIGLRPAYLFEDPERFDIIIFRYPDDESVYYIKRIIGLPGETLEIKNGQIYLNGSDEPLEEPNVYAEIVGDFGPYEVPEDQYFVLGDNRNESWDSRYWQNTYVPREKIVGKALFRLFPEPGLIS